jgi:glutamine---fructose-6-phosphate transaminase (isomerizing)
MCGIVAYIGNKQCKNILINGLKRLEYRGYDSAGIGILTGSSSGNGKTSSINSGNTANFQIKIVKEAGKIKMLE